MSAMSILYQLCNPVKDIVVDYPNNNVSYKIIIL